MLVNNRRYMQSENFWQDSHNKKMDELANKLLDARQSLKNFANQYDDCFYRHTDGTVEPIKYKGIFKYIKEANLFKKSFANFLNKEYNDIRFDMCELAKDAIENMK